MAAEKLERGKIAVIINYERRDSEVARITFNKKLLKSYYHQLKKIAADIDAPSDGLLKMVTVSCLSGTLQRYGFSRSAKDL